MEPTDRSPNAARAAAHRSHGNRCVRRATTWATVGALSVTGAFTALAGWSSHVAAHASTPTTPTPATSTTPQGSTGTQSTTPDTSGQGLAAPDTTPQFTQQPPVAASGGS